MSRIFQVCLKHYRHWAEEPEILSLYSMRASTSQKDHLSVDNPSGRGYFLNLIEDFRPMQADETLLPKNGVRDILF